MKKTIVFLILLAILGAVLVNQRVDILLYFMMSGEPPALLEKKEEGPGAVWFDDYYTVESLDERTFAIGETRYYQQNFNYLILGDDKALLFDAGTGARDIREVVKSLTSLPLTFVPSHLHYDHIGNNIDFEHVAVVGLPHLRERQSLDDGRLPLERLEHLGGAEGYATPTLEVHEWLAVNAPIELGGRALWVLYTPGHTQDSISLYDAESGYLFSGDFLYPGELFGFLPNSNLGDYLQGARTVGHLKKEGLRIFGAHRGGEAMFGDTEVPASNRIDSLRLPELKLDTVFLLQEALESIRAGDLQSSGSYPVSYPIDDRVVLVAEPSWLQKWEPIYPELELSGPLGEGY